MVHLQVVNGGAALQMWKVTEYVELAVVDGYQGVVFELQSWMGD
jgi:hypothetical protein